MAPSKGISTSGAQWACLRVVWGRNQSVGRREEGIRQEESKCIVICARYFKHVHQLRPGGYLIDNKVGKCSIKI